MWDQPPECARSFGASSRIWSRLGRGYRLKSVEVWPLKAEGQITVEDYAAAIRLHSTSSGLGRLLLPTVLLLLFLALVVQPLVLGTSLVMPIAAAIAIGLSIYFVRTGPERAAKAALRGSSILSAPTSLAISPEGFHASSQFGTSTLPWDVFVKRKRSDDLLLLYQSDGLFHIVARRWFASEASWHETLRLVDPRVPAPPGPTRRELLYLALLWIVLLAGIVAAFFQGAATR